MRHFILMSAIGLMGCQKVEPQPKAPLPANRFTVVPSNRPGKDYLIDTATGKTWISERLSKQGNRLVWVSIKRFEDRAQAEKFESAR